MAKRGRPREPNAKRERLTFRVQADEAEEIRKAAEMAGVSVTDLFRETTLTIAEIIVDKVPMVDARRKVWNSVADKISVARVAKEKQREE